MVSHEAAKYSLLKVLVSTVSHFFGGFGSIFGGLTDPRDPNRITYPLYALAFAGVWMYLCRLGSRRQIAHQFRNNGPSSANIQTLLGVADFPHGDTVNNAYSRLAVEEVQECMTTLSERLIRNKVLYPYRLLDRYFVVAIDGSGILTFSKRHCEHCLTRTYAGKTLYYHHVLEAKLVTSNGFCFSLMSEFIENPGENPTKQDCEIKAFYRLAERLKARFPRLPICLSLDGLFAGGPTFALCERYHWKYVIVLTEQDLPSVNREFEALLPLCPENRLLFHTGPKGEIVQQYRWVDPIFYTDSNKQDHTVSVLECVESKPDRGGMIKTTRFKWVTNHTLTSKNVIPLANQGGRIRWKIENEGFNVQKNGGFELEHAYSKDETAGKVFYYLLQIACILAQLIEKGSLLRDAFPKGVGSAKNLAFRLLEAWRNFCLTPLALEEILTTRFQIRFDDTS